MSIRVKVLVRDKKGTNFRTQEILRVKVMAELDTERLARECEVIIRETIMTKSEMPTGKLASNWTTGKIANGWGVGDIAQLDENVPYWNHIDKGSEGIGANWEHYLPKGFWVNGRWVESPNGFSGIKAKTPIQAMNYIAITLAQMEVRTSFVLKRTI